jgi:carbon-monoxide dehydrogenase large subunit
VVRTSPASGPGGGAGGPATVLGQSVLRKEDRPLLTGSSCFADDLNRPGALHAAILRSPHAHARIGAIDTSAARAQPGVVDVITSADLPDPKPRIPIRMYPRPGMEALLQPPLAEGVVRYSGEPVAVVVATSPYAAEDALEAIEVTYEPLAPVLDPEVAVHPDTPPLHAGAESNVAAAFEIESGDVDAAFAQADLVIEERLHCGRHAAVPLEPRGLLAELEPGTGRLVVYGVAKVVHTNRRMLARLLGWAEERIRFVELHVGGGFGARGEFYPEDYLIPFLALRLGRAVGWTEDRAENMRALNHSREQLHDVAIALREDGTLLGLRTSFLMNTGAYVRTHGAVVPNMTAALLPGPYRWAGYRCEVRQVVTNKTPAGTYRAPGRYEANFVRERMIDIAARRLGRDPADLRRQNLIPADAMPYAPGTHTDGHPVVFDSGDYGLLLDKGLERFGYDDLRRWRDEDPGRRRRRGIGVALFIEKSGIARWEYARVGIGSDGGALVRVGSASVGQGVQTVLAQICAEHLGVGYDDVVVEHGDTDVVPEGMGSFGSRATSLAGTAVMNAATVLRERVLRLAADRLEASPADLVIADGRVTVRGSERAAVTLAELAEAARPHTALAHGEVPGLSEEAYFDAEDMSFPYGLHLVAVEVDLETGNVDIDRYAVAYDVGRAINPQLVEGQIVGGAAQGIGGALLEELAYDDAGQLITGSFMDYLMPTASEAAPVEVLITEDAPTPLTPLGAKGAGEGGTAAAGAAIANAVSDALGAEATALPLKPERVLELAARGAAAAAAGGQAHRNPSRSGARDQRRTRSGRTRGRGAPQRRRAED